MPAGGDIGDWFKSLPIFTRYWFGLTLGFTLFGRFGLLSPHWLILLWDSFFHEFQLWRPVTALFFYPLNPKTGFPFLLNLYYLYNYSIRLETGIFDGRPADYLFMLIFNWLCCVIVGFFMEIYVLMPPMVLSVLYLWCQLNKDTIITFWFGAQFKAMYLPWVLLAFNVIIAGGGLVESVGILIGHMYFFLTFKYPQDFGGPRLLATPQILYKYLPNHRQGSQGYGSAPQAAPGNRGMNHSWGTGRTLGGN
ncbi:derlin-1 [Lepeophtheirus salmonis]|uniref:derlin-1 n=1 Tax=Lepeophtheirus salmonis TaxID=72036 RepID=UPI001AE72FDD|nr:derlin-1-like [Lepeophtheirus salmonis]